jgi:hypothetical protein
LWKTQLRIQGRANGQKTSSELNIFLSPFGYCIEDLEKRKDFEPLENSRDEHLSHDN